MAKIADIKGNDAAAVGAADLALPTAEQIAAWRALSKEQRWALREREAARIFAEAAEAHRAGDLDAALQGYGKALLLNPKIPDVYNNMGVALRVRGKLEAAVACYKRSLSLRPGHASVYSNMGNALRELGRIKAAVSSHETAIKLAPDNAEGHYNLGLALRDLGDVDRTMDSFDTALSKNPDHVECHWDRALTRLLMGDYKTGFAEYDWRWKLLRSPPRGYSEPQWDGKKFKGKTLLIHQEQGFGDMIQFARYLPMVKARGGVVVVEVHPELSRLFSAIDGPDKVVNRGAPLPRFDLFIPMITLARIFETDTETIPAETPYMRAPEMETLRLPPALDGQSRVGIAWAGRPTHKNDANRSCALTHFIDLASVPGVNIFSLQKGPREADIVEHGCAALIANMGPRLNDFADTAAILEQLDLVITVDTAVAHLAGALGKEVWVALPFAPDWRWLLGTDKSPWYPTMKLFRQGSPGDWDGVFADIHRALQDRMRAASAPATGDG